jgi:hypothetical protein
LCELGFVPGLVSTAVGVLEVGRRNVAAELVEAAVVEPVDPLGGRDLDGIQSPPRASGLDQLGLVEPVDGLSEGVDAPMKRPGFGGGS